MSDYQHHRRIKEQMPRDPRKREEDSATARVSPWVIGGAALVAAIFAGWLLLAPSDTNMGTANKPPATASENTGTRGGVPNPPQNPTTPQQETGQSQDATHDSTRGSPGPANPSQTR